MAVANRTLQILPGGQSAAPFTYPIPSSTSFALLGVRATFDGTAAAGAFLPCVQIISDAGVLMAQTVGSSVAAGASADVTFAPFLETAGGGGGTDPLAVHYNTPGQTGAFLESTTSAGTTLNNEGTVGTTIHDDDGTGNGGFVSITTGDGEVFTGSHNIVERIDNAGVYEVQNHSGITVIRVNGDESVEVILGSGKTLNVLGPFAKKILRVTDGGGGAATYEQQIGTAWVATL